MAEKLEAVVNTGEEVTNAPSSLPLKSDDQFRLLNQRLDNLRDELSRVAKPPQFRLADVMQLIAIVVGVLIALVGAFSLSERISDVRADQSAAERRLTDNVNAAELRLSSKLEKLSEQFSSMDERISRLEGQKSQSPK
jgi:hypothetical protein